MSAPSNQLYLNRQRSSVSHACLCLVSLVLLVHRGRLVGGFVQPHFFAASIRSTKDSLSVHQVASTRARSGGDDDNNSLVESSRKPAKAFDASVLNRYACKKFKRFDGLDDRVNQNSIATTSTTLNSTPLLKKASSSDPDIVRQVLHCLDLSRRAPSAFNTQPYKIVMVHSPEHKESLASHCLGPNKQRVLDSDCTAVFLADRQVMRTFPRFRLFLAESNERKKRPMMSRKAFRTMQLYITIFSSGYPLPRFLRGPISFAVRTAVSIVNIFTKSFYEMPSLSSSETWSSKQVMLVAMVFMLGCSARGIATIPMEGINAGGIRNVLGIPSRYAIPMIVSAGTPYKYENDDNDDDDPRPTPTAKTLTERYPMKEVIFSDTFGGEMEVQLPSS